MNINWYPGHMAKTKKQIAEDLKLIDVVIEILDARIPLVSQNPDIQELISQKKKVILLNKSDLADEQQNKRWIHYFKKKGITAVLCNCNSGEGIENALKVIEEQAKEEINRYEQKGRIGKSIRVMIIGIPNVGKSSFINRVSKKVSAQVGNKPGVTKQKQWIRVNKKIELLDTPGVLWPKLEKEKEALYLAYTGTIKADILEKVEVAFQLLKLLCKKHKEQIMNRYTITEDEWNCIMDNEQEENEKILQVMYTIGKKRGAIMAGGKVDEEKVAIMLLEDFKNGKIGRITLEEVEED